MRITNATWVAAAMTTVAVAVALWAGRVNQAQSATA